MNAELDDLYRQVILDHSKHPRNFREMADADHQAQGFNPLCGDRVKVFLKMADGTVGDVSFTGAGCAICTSSASLMTEAAKGQTPGRIDELYNAFHKMVTDKIDDIPEVDDLGKLAAFAGVKKYPIRVKCASLPWHTIKAALEKRHDPVSTE